MTALCSQAGKGSGYCKGPGCPAAATVESCDGNHRDPGRRRERLTGFGIYTAFGPPSKGLTDPFDDHDD